MLKFIDVLEDHISHEAVKVVSKLELASGERGASPWLHVAEKLQLGEAE